MRLHLCYGARHRLRINNKRAKERKSFIVTPTIIMAASRLIESESEEMKLQENKNTLPALLARDDVKKRFIEVLDKNAPNFMQTLLTVYNGNEQLKKCEPISILAAAGLAATLNLSISPSLGYAYIVPFGNKAQFQISAKGLVQLAHRTGRYTALHSGVVREGEIRGVDCITGELLRGEKLSEEIVGYAAFMRLDNGFEKSLYMTRAEVEEHAMTFSQTYKWQKDKSIWGKYFDKMACKTVLKLLLNRWGITSSNLSEAIQADQSVVTKNTFTYVDNGGNTVQREDYSQLDSKTTLENVDAETGEVIEEEDSFAKGA